VAVIEMLVKVGDTVAVEQSLFTVESDKASMEIPSPSAGTITALTIKLGDTVNIGDVVGQMTCRALRCALPAAAAVAARLPHLWLLHLHPWLPLPWPPCCPVAAPAHNPTVAPRAAAPCLAFGAQVRSRTGRASGGSQGLGQQGPHHGTTCSPSPSR
jgi:pyruvate dehydrogenase E2 component (dihydrolipoamide acetyltransferase)